MSTIRHRLTLGVQFAAIVLIIAVTTTRGAFGLSQHDLYTENINYFNLKDDDVCGNTANGAGNGSGSGSGSVTYLSQTPQGSDPEEQIWNFLVFEVHLSPAGAAGIMGNIQAESHFNPADEQAPGSWNDMSDVYQHAVGIVQWDGGRRPAYINYAKSHNADPKTLVPQLNYLWDELNNGYKSLLKPLQTTTDPQQAALMFHQQYEKSADSAARIQGRMNNATAILAKYQGKAGGSGTDTICPNSNNSLSPQCQAASGRARIICDAQLYDTTSYHEYQGNGDNPAGHQGGAAWHKSCPVIGPSCYLDCSGLVDVVIYDVYRQDLRENTNSERDDIGKYWQVIQYNQLQPGDIMQPFSGHVEIIDHVVGTTMYTFAAHTDKRPQPDQVGPSKYTQGSGQLYLRYIGPGA